MRGNLSNLIGSRSARCHIGSKIVQAEDEPVSTFRAGDELILTVNSTQDCYLTVFNVLLNDTVTVLVPSPYLREVVVQAGVAFQLPSESLRQQGFRLRITPMTGQRESEELLLAVATKTKIPFRGTTVQTAQAALTAINRWLIDIPLDQRTEASVLYRIVR